MSRLLVSIAAFAVALILSDLLRRLRPPVWHALSGLAYRNRYGVSFAYDLLRWTMWAAYLYLLYRLWSGT